MAESSNSSATGAVAFLHIIGQLKDTPRTGWVDSGLRNVESVSDHMYRMAVLCMMCPDETLDKNRLVQMALSHDMAEAIVGDISPKMKVPKDEKFRREKAAIDEMAALVPNLSGDRFREFWEEYEAQATKEAKFLRDMDLLEMVVQAAKYEHAQDTELSTFFASGAKIQHPWARGIYDELLRQRPETFRGRTATAPDY